MTLALALAGVILSLLSLLWQGYTWRLNGAVLRVKVTNTMPIQPDGRAGDHYVTVTVINEGRAPVTVMRWGIDMAGKGNLVDFAPVPWSTRLPHRLDAGTEASFHMPAAELRQRRTAAGLTYSAMVPWVETAGDRRYMAKGGLGKVLAD